MKRFIITGAPGAGKTSIVRRLELDGFSVVEEAATDVIAALHEQGVDRPWENPSFIDTIAKLQRDRLVHTSGDVQFHDRSVLCTAALAVYLGYPFTPFLSAEIDRVQSAGIYQKRVFFVRNLGFVTPTAARRISFEDSLRFENIHEETYRQFGFDLLYVEPAPVSSRVAFIKSAAV